MRKLSIFFALVALVAVFGCGDEFMTTDMESVDTNNGSTLTLMASPDNINIQAGGSVTIMITVLGPDGDGIEGATILLSSTMGTLTETELTTDIDGYTATLLTPGDVNGYAVVVGTYKGVQAMVEVDFWTSSTESDTGA